MRETFRKIAHRTSDIVGSPWAFIIAIVVVVAWAISGPFLGYSVTWQLIINTATTISTFLMVFLIQNTQNRDGRAVHLKLDELIKASRAARDSLIDLEDVTDEELDRLQAEFIKLRTKREGRRTHAHAQSATPPHQNQTGQGGTESSL